MHYSTKPISYPQYIQLAPLYSLLMNQVRMSKWQNDFALSSTMGYEPVFIGLKWIEVVEILVGEVDRRSPKDGSQAQLTQVNRDKACHKDFDLEDSRSLSFSLFTKGTAPTPWWQSSARVEPLFKQRVKVVPPPIFNTTQAMLKKVPLLGLRVEAVLGFYMQVWHLDQGFHFNIWEWGKTWMFRILSHADDEI